MARTAEIEDVISNWVARHDLEHVLEVLDKAEVPSGKIYDIADIAADAHYRAREMIQEFRLSDGTPLSVPGIVPRLAETPGETRWLGPKLGEHTAEVLAGLGYSSDELADFKRRGAI